MKISKYFYDWEVVTSSKGDELGIKNIPNEIEKQQAVYTASRMDEFREYLGVPLNVLSWFRCEELNNAVKGAKNSAHRQALAVDVFSSKMEAKEIYEKLKEAMKKGILSFDQLIYYPESNFVHCGFQVNKKYERKQSWCA